MWDGLGHIYARRHLGHGPDLLWHKAEGEALASKPSGCSSNETALPHQTDKAPGPQDLINQINHSLTKKKIDLCYSGTPC